MKKFLAMLLALIMVISLAACGSSAPAATEAPAAPEAPKAEEPAPAPADLPVITMLFEGNTVTPEASAKVMEVLNPYLAEKIGATLEPIWGTWGDFEDKAVLALQGGDNIDIYFTCNWTKNDYVKYARDGYYVKLDDLLDANAAELKALIPEGLWGGAIVEGPDGMGIYAVPGLKDTATQNCWDVNGTLLAELGYDVDAVCAAGLDFFSPEFEEMLAAAKAAKGPDFYPLLIEAGMFERMITHSTIITGDLPTNVLSYYYDVEHPANDLGNTIVNKYSTPEFAAFCARVYELSQKGYISPNCQIKATAQDFRTSCQNEGAYLFGTQSYAYGCEIEFSAARGIDVRMVPETAPYMDCTSSQGAMMAISTASKQPELALKFLNLLNTDPTVMTLVNYGVEGYTYTDNGDGTISFIDENRANYMPWRNGVGNIRILPPTAAEGLTYWSDFAAYYESAEAVPYGGFIFDASAFDTEAAGIANICEEYAFNLMAGSVDPETNIPAFLSALEAAGINEFVAAAQEQMAAYLG